MSGTVTKQSGFKNLYNDRSSRRIVIAVIAIFLTVVIYVLFFSSRTVKQEVSTVRTAPVLASTQGAVPPTPAYQQNLAIDDKRRQSDAKSNDLNLSYTPTMTVQTTAEKLPPTLNVKEAAPPPPLPDVKPQEAPRVVQQTPRPAQPAQQTQPVRQQTVYVNQPVHQPDSELQGAMSNAMKHMMQPVPTAVTIPFYSPNSNTQGSTTAAESTQSSQSNSAAYQGRNLAMNSQGSQGSYAPGYTGVTYGNVGRSPYSGASGNQRFTTPAPGTILYSHLVGKINSDTPGPVVAEILQGPFTGARLLGGFQFSEQGVIIKFSTMTVPYKDDNGVEKTDVMPITAVAVDTANLGTAMATDIDRHLWERIAVGFATSFLQGLGSAIASSGGTTVLGATGTSVLSNPVTNTRQQLLEAGGTAAGNVGQIFNQYYGSKRTTITVDADTPFGLLFVGNGNGQ